LVVSSDRRARVAAARNMDQETLKGASGRVSNTIVGRVLESGETVLLTDAGQTGAFVLEASVAAMKLRSVLCAPVHLDGRVAGALYVDNRFLPQKFGPTEARQAETLAAAFALALQGEAKESELATLRERLGAAEAALAEARAGLEEAASRAVAAPLPPAPGPDRRFPEIVGDAPSMCRMYDLMERVLDKDITVLILGESGTGKELVARALHRDGTRRGGPFVAVNCGAIPANLIESELFGHVRGAFTDASQDRAGLVEAAAGGILFLDEIGELPLGLQTRLLRFLQSGEFQKVGSTVVLNANVRILAATNKDLPAEVAAKRFREDLYYRLNVIQVRVPPLRERREDIPLLADHFLRENRRLGITAATRFTPAALGLLGRYRWPGNVRELEMVLKNVSLFADGDALDVADFAQFPHLASGRSQDPSGAGLQRFSGLTLEEVEREVILHALERNHGNKKRTAEELGIDRRTLYNKLDRYGR
ncbi:MAG: sigma-54-dependent Fis family transcriptional regulator, partial [Deltaproteobacteria bacterium]|nr:sigma-54-dependent Fis family transcriptional regulator [Deltaproteobacteria bacterium]